MPFSLAERGLLLQAKGVGPKVAERLEMLGADGFARLRDEDIAAVCAAAANEAGVACWKRSPDATFEALASPLNANR